MQAESAWIIHEVDNHAALHCQNPNLQSSDDGANTTYLFMQEGTQKPLCNLIPLHLAGNISIAIRPAAG